MVTTAPAPTVAPAPIRTPPRIVAPEPIVAPPLDHRRQQLPVGLALQLRRPPSVARGRLSLTNITPWPTKTSSSIVTPSQMKVWLWILQAAPITAPRWISTKVPIRVREPISHP